MPFLRRHPGYGGQDGTDSRLDAFQAINCLATIISPFFGTTNRHPDHIFEATSLRVAGFEDEDEDEDDRAGFSPHADTPTRPYADTFCSWT